MITEIILYAITILGGLNLLRVMLMLILTEVHEMREYLKKQNRPSDPLDKGRPWLSVIIPAYNEEASILKSVASVCANTYPHFEVIVVDDGSKDKTSARVRQYIRKHPSHRVKLVRQKNAGKAHALNNGISHHARGSLVMCLDADSTMDSDAIENTVRHFQANPRLVAMASNVHVTATWSLYGLMQKFEYLLSYRLKRAMNVMGSEYIIGGVGSTFRKNFIKKIGLYDTDTMTEDIDLTLKIVRQGNKKHQLGFGYDVHTYTEGVLNLPDLIKQRFRWKFGRMQTFLKNRDLFFNRNRKYHRTLTMFQLPYAIIGELALLSEPVFIGFIAYSAVMYAEIFPLLWIMGFMMFYMGIIIFNDRDIPRRQRIGMLVQTPIVWLLFYILTFVELLALLKCLVRLPRIKRIMANRFASRWDHVRRAST